MISGYGCLVPWETICCPYRNLCSIPGWFLVLRTFIVFHRFCMNFIDFHAFASIFMYFHRFLRIFVDLVSWSFPTVRNDLLPLQKPLLDSRLAPYHLETSIVFYRFCIIFIDFHAFALIFMYFHRLLRIFMDLVSWSFPPVRNDLLPLEKPLLNSRLVSCHLRTSIVFHRFCVIFMDFYAFALILMVFHRFLKIFVGPVS